MRRILVCLVLLSGCASTRTGYASDDFRADCPDVADAYEAARAHLLERDTPISLYKTKHE